MAGAHLPDDFKVAGPLGNSEGVVIARHISEDSIDDAARELGGFHILVSEGPAQPVPKLQSEKVDKGSPLQILFQIRNP